MNSYEILQLQVNERRAQIAHEFAAHRLARAARKVKPRTWLRRSASTVSTVADQGPAWESPPVARVAPV